jgi:RNA polymerase sigma factor (sigma-70 family)
MSVADNLDQTTSRAHPVREERRFTRLFDAHFRSVSAYARRRTTSAEADDAVAETFLVAWRRLDEVPENAKPWLLGVARRVLANQRRAAGRRGALAERIADQAGDSDARRPRPPVLRALSRLSEPDREVLLLVAWDGLSTAEGAVALGCSQTAFKVRLHRARGRLRTELTRLERDRPRVAMPSRLEECHDE